MIRAVIDTNVLVSGLLSPAGNEALIVIAIHQGLIRPCFSDAMMQEYAEVLARPKFGFDPDAIAAALAMFREGGELVVLRTVARHVATASHASADLPSRVTRRGRASRRGYDTGELDRRYFLPLDVDGALC